MRTQHEKNKEILMEEIEKYCNEPMNNAVAEKLSIYHGALKAMCLAEKGWEEKPTTVESYAAKTTAEEKPAHTPELDGDTEFEQVIMSIPADKAHMVAITQILNDHMTQLSVMHRRSYDNVMMRLREVARN